MKMFILIFALFAFAMPATASAMSNDQLLSDLARTGSIVHPNGIWGGK